MLYRIAHLNPALYEAVKADHVARLDLHDVSMWDTLPSQLIGYNNTKSSKTRAKGALAGVMYLAPADMATDGRRTLCAYADKAKCKAPCLYTAGRGRMTGVQLARIRKTLAYLQHPESFFATLDKDIENLKRKAAALRLTPAVRLNGTSDIDFSDFVARHPDVQFYDYTKNFTRVDHPLPPNYHLTLSYSEASHSYAAQILSRVWDHGGTVQPRANAAIVFRDAETVARVREHGWHLSSSWCHPALFSSEPVFFPPNRIIDGDEHDARFLDPGPGYIVSLTAKEKAKDDKSGFVVDV